MVALRARTEAIAAHLTEFLEKTRSLREDDSVLRRSGARERDARALGNLNADLVAQYPDYVCRVTADEGDIGRGHLEPLSGRRDEDAE